MDKATFDRLTKLQIGRDKTQANLKRYDDQIFAIYDICDHIYPNGTNAKGKYKCKICGR